MPEMSEKSNSEKVHRVVIFANGTLGVPAILIRGYLDAIAHCSNVEICAVCLPERPSQLKIFVFNLLYETTIKIRIFAEAAMKRKYKSLVPINIYHYARKYRFKVLVPPQGNINDPSFIAYLRDEIRPTIALSFYCLQKFSQELLAIFNYTVNYHNGLLPEYGGRNATAWSLYQGEKETGFTFHCMTDELDAGNILLQEKIPVGPDDNAFDLEMEKAITAAKCIPRILGMALNGYDGEPQKGRKRYYSWNDCQSITVIQDPSSLSKNELMNRLKAFEKLEIKLSGIWYEVTGLKDVSRESVKAEKLIFMTSDGYLLKTIHFLYLPLILYKAFMIIKKIFGKKLISDVIR